jgi:DNA-binding transcriptional LysR family regulator
VFDWNDLRYLLAVANRGTLVGAAKDLGVKHTTVARRVAALEESLGAKLFQRGADKYTLTESGLEILEMAIELKAKAEAVERRVAGADARIAGVVRVTMPEPTAGYFLRQLPALRERHPELVADILADTRMYDVARGESDIAIRVNQAASGEADLLERKVGEAAFGFYASKSYFAGHGGPAASVDRLDQHDFIGYLPEASPVSERLRRTVPNARIVMRCNGFVQVFNAALAGFGVALLPCFLGDGEPYLARALPQIFRTGTTRVLVRADMARVPRIRAMFDFIVEVFTRDERLFDGSSVGQAS